MGCLLLAVGVATPLFVGAQEPPILADRILAAVDGDPVYLSDVRRTIALGLVELQPDETALDLERRVLDALIEQRLRLHEVERYGVSRVSAEEVEAQVENIRARFGEDEAWRRRLLDLGLDGEGIRLMVARQLRILAYIEERLGPRVFVDLDEIRSYYDDELRAEMERRGALTPPLEEVREEIRRLLREQRLNAEIETWTEELRFQAEIVDLFDQSADPSRFPPVSRRILNSDDP